MDAVNVVLVAVCHHCSEVCKKVMLCASFHGGDITNGKWSLNFQKPNGCTVLDGSYTAPSGDAPRKG